LVVLVTGCRSGFGLLAAVEAARRGHTVYAGLRDVATAPDALKAERITPIQLDVTNEADRKAVVERILADHGQIDALVNNAGISLGGFLEQVEDDELRRLYEVNAVAPFALTKAVLPSMRARRDGVIVMVSSMAGRFPLPSLGAYASSKWALEGLSEVWRHELAPWGIRVVIVEPGPYKTDLLERNRVMARHANDPDSPWAPMVRRISEMESANVASMAGDPMDVALRIVDAIEARRPRLRYPMGRTVFPREVLRRFAPFWVIEAVVRRVMRLPAPR
jgi:NAD(P)-dependent dehydrogenase (short-subunit alcohol dehydrogenase family)